VRAHRSRLPADLRRPPARRARPCAPAHRSQSAGGCPARHRRAGAHPGACRPSTEEELRNPMLIAFSVAPSGAAAENPAGSVHDAVAAAVKVVRESGLPHRTTSMFTEIEGPDWDTVMDVVRRAVEAVQPFGSRVSLVLKADIR